MEEEADIFDPNFPDVLEAPSITKRQIMESADLSEADVFYVIEDDEENFVVLPKVYNGEKIDEQQAKDLYLEEDFHIGIFQSEYSANEYAEQLEEIARNLNAED